MTVQVVSGNGQEKHRGDVFIKQQQWYNKNTSVKNDVLGHCHIGPEREDCMKLNLQESWVLNC